MLKIIGFSDDTVDFIGTGELIMPRKPMKVLMDDNTVFTVEYDEEGIWRIEVLNKTENYHKLLKNEERTEEEDPYSDILYLKGLPLIKESVVL